MDDTDLNFESSGLEIMRTALPEVMILVPRSFADERGSFVQLFRSNAYAAAGIVRPFVQDNLTRSGKGVVRGLHLQNPNLQGKLVTAIRGRVLDVCVDVRLGSPSFGQYVSVELSHENRRQLWVPRGFAHGFSVLSESADVLYKCDAFYDPASEITIDHADPALGIDWQVATPILSPKDRAAAALADTAGLPVYRS